MAVYFFNLLVGHILSGVEHAQGYRALLLRDSPHPVKFVFTESPGKRYIDRYIQVGISTEQMLSIHQYFTNNRSLEVSTKIDDKLEELKEDLHYTDVKYQNMGIHLVKDGSVIATLLLEETDQKRFYAISYFTYGKLIRTEYYTSGISYADYYVTAKSDKGLYAKVVRRTFYNRDGSVAYEQIWKGQEERYLFPDGRVYTKPQFVAEFIKRLELSERDIVFLDRGAQCDFVQPLFQFGGKARVMTFLHSGHYFEKGEDPFYYLYLNYEYYYWFKYSGRIDTIVVSTQEQKEELIQKLKEYECAVPDIAVIPVAGLDRLRYPAPKRKRHSLITVSRLNQRKHIDWIIRSVIKAHQINPNIFIDIYGGKGREDYFRYLQDIVSENHAQTYVTFKGYMDVTEVYQNYEVFISASLWETLGLSLMEAVGSGTAMIGLDVKYGNRLFIQPEKNGYLIDFDPGYAEGAGSELIDQMAERIVEIFEDEERLEEFHRASYEIAKGFSTDMIAKKWKDLLM